MSFPTVSWTPSRHLHRYAERCRARYAPELLSNRLCIRYFTVTWLIYTNLYIKMYMYIEIEIHMYTWRSRCSWKDARVQRGWIAWHARCVTRHFFGQIVHTYIRVDSRARWLKNSHMYDAIYTFLYEEQAIRGARSFIARCKEYCSLVHCSLEFIVYVIPIQARRMIK